ncbi:DNA repair protein RecO [Patescibacteria group bacterium]
MNKFNTEAIVLKHIKYKDTDKIYTLLSKDKGKISAIAKGVRKITSRRSGSLDTLNNINVQINKHKSGQNYIVEASVIKAYSNLKKDFELLKKSFYLVELVNKALWEDESTDDIYSLLVKAMSDLEETKEKPEILINKFEIKFMQLLGYEPKKSLLLSWREKIRAGEHATADMLVKNFVSEMLEENLKSLELD